MKSRNQSQCAIPCNTQGSPAYSPPIFSNGSLSDIEAPNLGFCLEVSANFFFGGWHSKSSMMSSSNFIALAFFTIHPTYLSKIPDLTQTLEVLLGNFDSIITMGMTSSRPRRKIPMHYVYLFQKKTKTWGCLAFHPTRLLQRPRIKIGKPPKVEQSLSNRKDLSDVER